MPYSCSFVCQFQPVLEDVSVLPANLYGVGAGDLRAKC
jgi:hypothetical protein